MIKICISVTSHALDPSPCQKLYNLLGPPPLLERDVLYGWPLCNIEVRLLLLATMCIYLFQWLPQSPLQQPQSLHVLPIQTDQVQVVRSVDVAWEMGWGPCLLSHQLVFCLTKIITSLCCMAEVLLFHCNQLYHIIRTCSYTLIRRCWHVLPHEGWRY